MIGSVAGILGVYVLDPKWGFNFWGFPTSYGAYGGAFAGFFGGLIGGQISKKFTGTRIFVLLIFLLSIGCGALGGISYSLVAWFTQ